MRDAPVWKDEFSQVLRQDLLGKMAGTHAGYYGVLYSISIKELKADGFAQWLTDSFCGPEASLAPGHFSFGSMPGEGGEQWFWEVFHGAASVFDAETVAIAREGMAKAVAELKDDIISYTGVFEMTECCAILGMREEFERLMPTLLKKEEEFHGAGSIQRPAAALPIPNGPS